MGNSLSKIFLGVASALLLFGGAVHTLAFKKAATAIAASDIAPFFGKALKALWLIDSTMLITLGIVFGLIAVRPVVASSVVVALLTLIPAIVAILLYCIIGAVMPAHLLVVVAALGFAAALLRHEA